MYILHLLQNFDVISCTWKSIDLMIRGNMCENTYVNASRVHTFQKWQNSMIFQGFHSVILKVFQVEWEPWWGIMITKRFLHRRQMPSVWEHVPNIMQFLPSVSKMYHSQTWQGYWDKLHHLKVIFQNLIFHVNQSSVCNFDSNIAVCQSKQKVQIMVNYLITSVNILK